MAHFARWWARCHRVDSVKFDVPRGYSVPLERSLVATGRAGQLANWPLVALHFSIDWLALFDSGEQRTLSSLISLFPSRHQTNPKWPSLRVNGLNWLDSTQSERPVPGERLVPVRTKGTQKSKRSSNSKWPVNWLNQESDIINALFSVGIEPAVLCISNFFPVNFRFFHY